MDAVFRELPDATREILVELVQGMAEGMQWAAETFERQENVLTSREQLTRYCHSVLGLPLVFAVKLVFLHHRKTVEIPTSLREHSLRAGEFIQLANVLRDVEKDLARGIAYHADLRPFLGATSGTEETIHDVRRELLEHAAETAPSYASMFEALPFPRLSLGRASGTLMMLFTDRFYRDCRERVGLESWRGPRTGIGLLLGAFPSFFSRGAASRRVRGCADLIHGTN